MSRVNTKLEVSSYGDYLDVVVRKSRPWAKKKFIDLGELPAGEDFKNVNLKIHDAKGNRLVLVIPPNTWDCLRIEMAECTIDTLEVVWLGSLKRCHIYIADSTITLMKNHDKSMNYTFVGELDLRVARSHVGYSRGFYPALHRVEVQYCTLEFFGDMVIDSLHEYLGANLEVRNMLTVDKYRQEQTLWEKVCPQCMESDELGLIVYKMFGAFYDFPRRWEIACGSVITEPVDSNRSNECSTGISVSPNIDALDMVVHAQLVRKVVWKARIRWNWLPRVVFPWMSTSQPITKFRTGTLELLTPGRVINKVWMPLSQDEYARYMRAINVSRKQFLGSNRDLGAGILLSNLEHKAYDPEQGEEDNG